MVYKIIQSGSKGNALLINGEILIDCGVPFSKIKDYTKDLKIVLLTHRHSDHLNITTLRKLKREKPNVKYVCGGYLVPILVFEAHIDKKNIFTLDIGKWYDMGLLKAKIEYLKHDVPNVAWHIEYKGDKGFYATDTATLDHIQAKDYENYWIEANYESDEELDKEIALAEEKGEYTHLKRVKYTHLSMLQAINWLDKNKGENSSWVFMHKHVNKNEN